MRPALVLRLSVDLSCCEIVIRLSFTFFSFLFYPSFQIVTCPLVECFVHCFGIFCGKNVTQHHYNRKCNGISSIVCS